MEIDKNLPDGIYPHLSDAEYFAQPRLGSSDLTKLCSNCPENYWYSSPHNTSREEPEKDDELLMGKAVHTIVLEGREAFFALYERSPFKTYGEAGAKAWKLQVKAQKKVPLSGRSFAAAIQMGELVLHHPQLKELFENAPGEISGMSEVAVLFTMGGVKMRAKFDRLMIARSIDLKTAGSHKMLRTDEETFVDIIVKMRYSVQRALYDHARMAMADLFERGMVFGADEDEMEWLRHVVARKSWDWIFVFVKKLSHSGKNPSAPIVTPLIRPMNDATYTRGIELCEIALGNYLRLAKGGLKTPWARINKAITPDDQKFIDQFMRPQNLDAPPEPEDEENED